jgi:predicted 3-demethylubiquinone-9 3-methyltransferase (glyoxalase superfamily)
LEGGMALMPLDSYSWSKKYGWLKDKYDVTWQIFLGEKQSDQKIIPTLMFIHENNGKAMKRWNCTLKFSRIPKSEIF